MRIKPQSTGRVRLWCLAVLLVLVPAFSGCAVIGAGKAGVSLGATAVKTTGRVGGAAIGATGSVLGAGEPDEAKDAKASADPDGAS